MATKVRIKRSTTNVPSSLDGGELAYSSLNGVFYIGSPSGNTVTAIGGVRNPGVLTANQALVANSTLGIDKVITGNLVTQAIYANGSFGSAGHVLVTPGDGTNAYWQAVTSIGAGVNTDAQYAFSNTITFNGAVRANTVNATSYTTGSTGTGTGGIVANATTILVGNNTINSSLTSSLLTLVNSTTNVQITPASIRVTNTTSASFTVNTTQITLGAAPISANGGVGSAGQVLTSAGAGNVYWSTPQVGDITSVTAGAGLTGGGTSGDATLDVGAGNGITVAADTVGVLANNGIIANSTGVFVNANTTGGLVANTSGLHVLAGSGLLSNSTGLHVGTGNGIAVDADSLRVVAGNTQLVSNATGVWITQSNIDHNSLLNYDANKHIDHTAVSITAGNGLTGGGTIAASRTIDVGAGNGIAVAADSVAVLANSGIVSNSTGVFVLANTSSGLIANATGVHAKVSSTVVLDGTGNLAVNSAALSFQDLTVSGNLTVLGDLVSLNVATLSIEDSLITLAKNQGSTATPTDALDIGLFGVYGNTANLWYTGLFRDQSDSGIWKLFQSNGVVSNTNVDTSNTSLFSLARLQTYLISSGLTTNLTHVAVTANSTVNVTITANSLTLATALAATSGGTGTGTYAVGDLLVGTTGNSLLKLAIGTDGKVLQSNGTTVIYDDIDGGSF